MVTLPAAGYIENDARTQAEAKQFFEDLRQFVEDRFGLDSGILAASRNYLINGAFELWQRNTTATFAATARTYVADRWYTQLGSSGGSITVSRQAFTVGQTDVPGEPTYYWRGNQTSAPTGGSFIWGQRVESVRTLAGQTATLSFYAKADTAQTVDIKVTQNFGTGGSPSSDVTLTQSISLTTSWQQFVVTFSVPSISGKTIGTTDDGYLEVLMEDNAGTNSTFTIDIARAQLEAGSGATPFDTRPLQTELRLARRYFNKSFPVATVPAQNAGLDGAATYIAVEANINTGGVLVAFDTPLRIIAPTMTFYNPSAANALWRNTTGAADSGAGGFLHRAQTGFFFTNAQASGDAVGDIMAAHWTAEAEF